MTPALSRPQPHRRLDAVRDWFLAPRLDVVVILLLALAIFLRKPSHLLTPQLWAEDGTIFLVQADRFGIEAFLMPHVGYLHLLQRTIAWSAQLLLDPRWWPAWYNAVAFGIWLAAAARCFSRRLAWPGAPWLALALVAVPHDGEVFFCVTNLQWVTALVLVQQTVIAPPANGWQRASDLLLTFVLVLTGPFGVAFVPLFVWRWWRDRCRDHALLLAVVALGAVIQAVQVVQMGAADFQTLPVQVVPIVEVFVRRVVLWPLLGRDLVLALPQVAIVLLGGGFLLLVFGWALRPHPRRATRGTIVAAFVLVALASAYRARFDLWTSDNLTVVDRYFYVPQVLLAWLLILEFDARPHAVGWLARAFCVTVFVVHARDFTIPAPRDFDWAAHVEPIRRGERADIPILPEGWILEYPGRTR